jgi:hypothetical protein
MTNGEKLCVDFPNMRYTMSEHRVITTIGVAASFDLDWWNAEYEEPSSSGKPNKSEIPTGSDDCISRQAVEDAMYDATRAMDLNYGQIMDYIDNLPSVTPIRPKGYWRTVDTNMYACSKCSHVLTIDPLDNSILEMNTCPFCSAKMEAVEE